MTQDVVPPPAGGTLLTVHELAKAYGRNQVLDGLSFNLEAGAIVVLAGGNGAGKSTLLRCLAGLANHRGAARLAGLPLDGSPTVRRLIGYIPQSVALPETTTVAEVVTLFARLRGADPRSPALPEGFLPPLERAVGTLSGGQRQRVVLTAALLGDPLLLLLDEPAASLDPDGQAALWALLRERADHGAGVLIASPTPGDLDGLADRRITLAEGRIVEPGRAPVAPQQHRGDRRRVVPLDPQGPWAEEVPA